MSSVWSPDEVAKARALFVKAVEGALPAAAAAMAEPVDSTFDFVGIPSAVVRPVQDALLSFSSIASLDGKQIRHREGASQIQLQGVARTFLAKAVKGHSAEEIFDDFVQIVTGGTCVSVTVMSVDNLSVAPFSLSETIAICRPSDLPKEGAWRLAFPAVPDWPPKAPRPARLALTHREVVAVTIAEQGSSFIAAHHEGPQSQMRLALKAIMLGSDAAPREVGGYQYIESPGWPGNSGYGYVEHVEPTRGAQSINVEELELIRAAFGELVSSPHQSQLRTAIFRLETARKRFSADERATELGSCLEVLLMHGNDTGNAEITFKLRTRAAWLLGADQMERRAIYKLVGDAYSLRSTAVHQGYLPTKSNDERARQEEILSQADALCARLILHIMKHGWPDWTTTVLGLDKDEAPELEA